MQPVPNQTKDVYHFSRLMYILEAALEYFISILVGGAYLANLTAAIGLSDGVTGILTSFVSLGCSFQIVALLLVHRKPVKRWVTALHLLNQLAFTFLYLVPSVPVGKDVKTVVFVVLLLLGFSVNNVVASPKINWYMSLVDDHKRGVFTAKKEIISLLSGMIFSYSMGALIDRFEANGNMEGSFIVTAVTLFVLTVLHTATLVLSKEKPTPQTVDSHARVSVVQAAKQLLCNRRVLHVILLSALWHVVTGMTTPFYGTWQRGELGFSMTFITLLSVVYAIVRSVCSPALGKFADKTSFFRMLRICYAIAALSLAINVLIASPQHGKLLYAVYYALYAVSQAGINSGAINLIYEQVQPEQRMSAYALQQSIGGTLGFMTTLAVSPLVDYIQANGNQLFGVPMYAQQLLSGVGVVLTIVVLLLCRPLGKQPNGQTGGASV